MKTERIESMLLKFKKNATETNRLIHTDQGKPCNADYYVLYQEAIGLCDYALGVLAADDPEVLHTATYAGNAHHTAHLLNTTADGKLVPYLMSLSYGRGGDYTTAVFRLPLSLKLDL